MDKNITMTLTYEECEILRDLLGDKLYKLRDEEAPDAHVRISTKGLIWSV